MNSFKLSEIVETKARFGRSVNLERDFYEDVSLDGYVLTTTALSSLQRLTDALSENAPTRAWTLTGAFGSGKSTFALFASKVFSYERTADFEHSKRLIRQKDVELWKRVFENDETTPKFFPVLISGSREPLAQAILRGTKSALINSSFENFKNSIAEIERLEQSTNVTGKDIVNLFSSISKSINFSSKSKIGLLVIIDEFGKMLEYAALNPQESDIFIFQELAEATKQRNYPFFLITILHQAFERYAERLGRSMRDEWAKIQSRFENLPFQEPNEQVLHILESVFVQNKESANYKTFNNFGIKLAQQAFDLQLCGFLERREAVSLLRNCLPLHPTVALALGSIFRRFGQNERSLFAFLTSSEPFGLSEFLKTTVWTETSQSVIHLDRVYDYLVSAMGSALYSGADGRKWAEIETAIHRAYKAAPLEVRVLKSIGLLYLLNDAGNLKSSRKVLHFALTDEKINKKAIDEALENLQKESIITFRRFNDSFVPFEGSDVDLEDRFREADREAGINVSLAENLMRYFNPRPVVAKRHSHRTGTLRYFDVLYKNASDLDAIKNDHSNSGDGKIIFALTKDEEDVSALLKNLSENKFKLDKQTVVAVPKNLEKLREAVHSTICWRWVQANTPELENDRAARIELAAHIAHAEQTVFKWLEDWQTGAASTGCVWFWQCEKKQFASPRRLQEFLSEIFDTVFPDTPILKNELINRSVLSGAATSARRNLFEAMLTNPHKENLGIKKFPPQISMYFSVLQETTIHRIENGKLGFFPPDKTADKGIRAVWQEIERFLDETENERKTAADLFERLQLPPFGLKAGILPILLTAALLYFDAEVALYERGNFLPKLTLPIFERLCRAPEAFTLQLCRISGMRSQVLNKMAEVLLPDLRKGKKVDVLTLVRPLARFAQELEEYTQHTSRLSKNALNVRRALFSAREPDRLLFKLLPQALGMKEFTAQEETPETVEKFSKKLTESLGELKRAYPELLNEIEAMLLNAFALPEIDGRTELVKRAKEAEEFAASAKLKGFILRVKDEKSDRPTWLESIAALLAGKPPAVWHDDDLARFEIGLAETARSFTNLESLVIDRKERIDEGDSDFELVRLSLTHMNADESARVLAIRPQDKEKIEEAEREILKAFAKSNINGDINLRLAVLANLSLKMLNEVDKKGKSA